MLRRACPFLLLLLAAGACARGDAAEMPRDKFVRVNVALRLVPDTAPDAAARRAAILRRERVTAAQLEAWVRANGRDEALIAATWQEIASRVDSAGRPPREGRGGDSASRGATPAATLPPPPPGAPQDLPIRSRSKPPSPEERVQAADSIAPE